MEKVRSTLKAQCRKLGLKIFTFSRYIMLYSLNEQFVVNVLLFKVNAIRMKEVFFFNIIICEDYYKFNTFKYTK